MEPQITLAELQQQLINWVVVKSQNGISQHDEKWLKAKVGTVGGSSIAVIAKLNPYQTMRDYIATKIGLKKFISDIRPQWGNLFEPVITKIIEQNFNCIVHGEDLFVMGDHFGVSYSPDGLSAIEYEGTPQIVLWEFKCPFSRSLGKAPPVYYTPQVKMGLVVLKIPSVGVYAEAVFRRCAWDQCEMAPGHDHQLVARPTDAMPLKYGIIGFYTTDEMVPQNILGYLDYYKAAGNIDSDYQINDLGDSSVELFTSVMKMFDDKKINIWYGTPLGDKDTAEGLNSDLAAFTNHCQDLSYTIIGILPWKLLQLNYHKITKEEDYLTPYLPMIELIIKFSMACVDLSDNEKIIELDKFCNEHVNNDCFIDDDEF
jgi:hypothetical protein